MFVRATADRRGHGRDFTIVPSEVFNLITLIRPQKQKNANTKNKQNRKKHVQPITLLMQCSAERKGMMCLFCIEQAHDTAKPPWDPAAYLQYVPVSQSFNHSDVLGCSPNVDGFNSL